MNDEEKEKKKLIVVDDDESIRSLLQIIFRNKGFDVRAADGGASFFELMKDFNPHAVILDVMMPEMDGESICAKIRQDRARDNVKIFFLSVMIPDEDKLRLLKEKYQVSEYFLKPFEGDELADKVQAKLTA
jgi:two-component system OmpR family response regulator